MHNFNMHYEITESMLEQMIKEPIDNYPTGRFSVSAINPTIKRYIFQMNVIKRMTKPIKINVVIKPIT